MHIIIIVNESRGVFIKSARAHTAAVGSGEFSDNAEDYIFIKSLF